MSLTLIGLPAFLACLMLQLKDYLKNCSVGSLDQILHHSLSYMPCTFPLYLLLQYWFYTESDLVPPHRETAKLEGREHAFCGLQSAWVIVGMQYVPAELVETA